MPSITFKGKPFVQNHHLSVKFHELVPEPNKSITEKVNLKDNLIIHGDNLKALKALLPTYSGKVNCIYIDPPYNTSNEKWIYNDNVNSPMIQEWLGKVVDKEDLTRNDKWLCMMMPRLKMLRELLHEEGVIFISIDDHEQHRLRMLMDEIFGQENFITNIIWQKKFSPQNDANYFSDMHDFILCYARNKIEGDKKIGWVRNLLPRTAEMDARYKNFDNDPRGPWTSSDLTVKTYSKDYDYEISTPSGRNVKPTNGRCWSTSKERMKELIDDDRIWFGEKGNNVPRVKKFLSEVQDGIVPVTVWLHDEVGNTQGAKQELKRLFPESDMPFQTPKPTSLIKKLLEVATKPGDIILDSFAGSGTTGQAVIEMNLEDETNEARKFILIEMEDYAEAVTAERIKRVIKNSSSAKRENTFSFFSLGDPVDMEAILNGENLPSFANLARYLFFTATGEILEETLNNVESNLIGFSNEYEVYLFYKPEMNYLKNTALTLEMAKHIAENSKSQKKKLVFAPMKFLEQDYLDLYKINFVQIPYEIYNMRD